MLFQRQNGRTGRMESLSENEPGEHIYTHTTTTTTALTRNNNFKVLQKVDAAKKAEDQTLIIFNSYKFFASIGFVVGIDDRTFSKCCKWFFACFFPQRTKLFTHWCERNFSHKQFSGVRSTRNFLLTQQTNTHRNCCEETSIISTIKKMWEKHEWWSSTSVWQSS